MTNRHAKIEKLTLGEKISGEVVEIWAATCNEERSEGRGNTIDNSYHLSRHEALIATKGIDVMGSDGKVVSRTVIRLKGGRYLLGAQFIAITSNPEAEASLREQALAKLSSAEIAALLGNKK